MAVIRRPTRMTDSGVQPQRGVGEVLLEEAGRAGIGLVGGVAKAALQPLVTSFGPEGSIGRDFVSPEIREMKRREAESMAAARVAPYYTQQQTTQRTGMSEAAKTQRTQMGLEQDTEKQKLVEGSAILQTAMKLMNDPSYIKIKARLSRSVSNLGKVKPPEGMLPESIKLLKTVSDRLTDTRKYGVVDESQRALIYVPLLEQAKRDPLLRAYLVEAGELEEVKKGVKASPETKGKTERQVLKLKSAEKIQAAKLDIEAQIATAKNNIAAYEKATNYSDDQAQRLVEAAQEAIDLYEQTGQQEDEDAARLAAITLRQYVAKQKSPELSVEGVTAPVIKETALPTGETALPTVETVPLDDILYKRAP
jgi:hypothetical protein